MFSKNINVCGIWDELRFDSALNKVRSRVRNMNHMENIQVVAYTVKQSPW